MSRCAMASALMVETFCLASTSAYGEQKEKPEFCCRRLKAQVLQSKPHVSLCTVAFARSYRGRPSIVYCYTLHGRLAEGERAFQTFMYRPSTDGRRAS